MPMGNALQVVVIRILSESAVEQSPRQIVNSVLLVFYGLGDDFGVEMVMKLVV